MDGNGPEFFYTLDLGSNFGPRLQRLAVMASCEDDIEAFASVLLCSAIEMMEANEAQIIRELRAMEAKHPVGNGRSGREIDDDIPL